MSRRLLRPLPLVLLVLICAAGPALAERAAQKMPDAHQLVAGSSYTPDQKRALATEIARARTVNLPAEGLARLTAMSLARGIAAEDLGGFYRFLRQIRADRLPVTIFENKMVEGLAKGASAELILHVVQEKERNYLLVRQLMVENLQRGLLYDQTYYQVLDLGAEGLRRGLPPEGLARIFHTCACSLREMGVAVRAYLYMQAIGFPLGEGLDIVTAALDSGQFRECRTCLGQVIFAAKRSGAPPAKIRDELVQGMRSGRDLGEISRTFYTTPQR